MQLSRSQLLERLDDRAVLDYQFGKLSAVLLICEADRFDYLVHEAEGFEVFHSTGLDLSQHQVESLEQRKVVERFAGIDHGLTGLEAKQDLRLISRAAAQVLHDPETLKPHEIELTAFLLKSEDCFDQVYY